MYIQGITFSLVEIYTHRTGAWRSFTASGPPNNFTLDENVFFNGAVHWPARTPPDERPFRNFIMSFDMEDEVFGEMPMPESLQDVEYFEFDMAVVDGLLALSPYGDNEDIPVWVMKEYGRVESWTKQFDIKFQGGSWYVDCFRKNGDVLLTEGVGHLFYYERNGERTWDLHLNYTTGWSYFDNYVETLALLDVADGVLGVQATSYCASKLKKKERKRKRKIQR